MKFIIEPNDGSWVAVKPDFKENNLARMLLGSDILFSDLDDTDAPSPAKAIVYSILRTSYANPRFLLWCLITELKLVKTGKNVESELWRAFVERFLGNQQSLRIMQRYTPEFARGTLYPGVQEFYEKLPPEVMRVYLTRNIGEIGNAYKIALGFHEVIPEAFDKVYAIRKVLEANPARRRIILKGDSLEDKRALDFILHKQRKHEVDEVTSIYVADSPRHLNPSFDINIGRNYNGLVRLIKESSLPVFQHA